MDRNGNTTSYGDNGSNQLTTISDQNLFIHHFGSRTFAHGGPAARA